MPNSITHAIRAGRSALAATIDLDPLVHAARMHDVRETTVEFFDGRVEYPFRIVGTTVFDPEQNRFEYTANLQMPIGPSNGAGSSASSDMYADDPAGEGITFLLYNIAEERDPEVSSSPFTVRDLPAFGNGVVVADLPAGMRLSPIPTNRVVWAWWEAFADGGEWRFDSPNGINGDCSSGSGS